jgi:potassium efflux system protein
LVQSKGEINSITYIPQLMLKFTFQHRNSNKKNTSFSWKHIFAFLALISFFQITSQTNKIITDPIVDSLAIQNKITQISLENAAKVGKKQRQNEYINYQNIQKQNKIFSLIKSEVKNSKFLLDKGFDYKNITEEIHQLKEWNKFVVKGIVGKKLKVLTDRNLSSTSILLDELLKRANNRLANISLENQQLSKSLEKIDSLAAQKNLYYVPTDSISRVIYQQQSLKMNTDIDLIKDRLKNAVDSIQTLEILGDQLKYKIESDIIENDLLRKSELKLSLTKKVPVFGNINLEESIVNDPILYSIKTNYLVIYFYVVNNINSILTMLILIIGTSIYFKLQKKRHLNLGYKSSMASGINILNSPISTAILVVLSIFQFILPMPPLIFSTLIWTISSIALTIMLWKSIRKKIWIIWIAIFIMNLIAIFDLMILIYFVAESYLIVAINSIGIGIGIYSFIIRKEVQNKFYLWYIGIATILQIFSLFLIINGHYNLGKFLMSKGVYTIIVAFSLYSAFISVMEINMVSKFLNASEEEQTKNHISSIPHQFSIGFYLLIFICCFFLMARNTYTFQNFVNPLKNSFAQIRTFGNVTFSFENISMFIIVILLSSFVSKVVSFLATETQVTQKTQIKSIGSWLFLSKITIVTIGTLVAFASAGIPLDKITIIISALGVGIGFGMQGLVNNLIGGLIIAFEKPVNLNDVIEVGGQAGKMKSIGIRSSVITTFDGADVIIPNGELLNQNLTNWTLGNNKRRSAINIGIAYGTDLELAEKLLFQILDSNENVIQNPRPMVWFTKFNDNAIDVVIKYWILHFDLDNDIRSELIKNIDKTFKENDIVIPFSQHDIHIISNTLDNKLKINPKEET